MKNIDKNKINLKGSILADSSMTGKISMAAHYSLQHIQSAALFSRLAANIEKEYKGLIKQEIQIEHKAYVIGAIFTVFSFLDSTINEYYWDISEIPKKFKNINSKKIKVTSKMWKQGINRMSTLEKYQFALSLADKPIFDKGKAPYQNIELLRQLRNDLIHFRPEWVSDSPQDLEKSLKRKFKLNPFFDKTTLFFPHLCLSYGCAKWAVTSGIKFTDEFFKRMNLEPRYNSVRFRLATE